jgi:transcriptional regulator with XRE-family HTH domain
MEDTELGELLRRHRRGAGLTQEELAERAGVSTRTVSDVERGLRDRVYRDTAARIAVALGMGAADRALFEAAARGRSPGSGPGRQWREPLRTALPVPLTRLIGRERELAAVLTSFRESGLRLLTLTGAGGIGKTRLAIEATSAARPDFPGGICFVSLAETHEAALVATLLARALGVDPADEPFSGLVSRIDDRRMLLTLDTFEHVLDAAPLVADLLASCPRLSVLATSRAPLRLHGEHELSVPPLGLEPAGPAATLFAERAGAVRPELAAPLREDAAAVVDLCRRLDGLPLAIELAAARIKHLPLMALRDALEDRLGLLSGGPRDMPPRQRAMRDTVGWSYDLLDRNGQAMLRHLSVFESWTLASARAVCTDEEPAVDVLAELAPSSTTASSCWMRAPWMSRGTACSTWCGTTPLSVGTPLASKSRSRAGTRRTSSLWSSRQNRSCAAPGNSNGTTASNRNCPTCGWRSSGRCSAEPPRSPCDLRGRRGCSGCGMAGSPRDGGGSPRLSPCLPLSPESTQRLERRDSGERTGSHTTRAMSRTPPCSVSACWTSPTGPAGPSMSATG